MTGGGKVRIADRDSFAEMAQVINGRLQVDSSGGGGGGGSVDIVAIGGNPVTTTLPVSDGGGSLTVDGTVAVSSIGGTVTIAEPVSVDDNGGSLTVDGTVAVSSVGGTVSTSLPGFVSAGNATTTPLAANATFTGTWEDLRDYATLSVTVYANVESAAGGLQFQWSGDGVTEDESEDITISASHPGRAMAFNVRGRYLRIRYTNGGTAQTTFRLNTVYRPSGSGTNNHTITEVLEDTTLAIITRSVIAGQTTGGGGGYHNVKVTPSGALVAEVTDGGGSITVDGTVAVSNFPAVQPVNDNGGSLTVDGTVSISGTVTVADGGGSLTVDGTVAVSSVAGTVTVADGGGSLTVDGTVAVNGVTPGTAATNLGKAEDAAHGTGDVGVMALAVRQDVPSALAGTSGDYIPLTTNAQGALRTHIVDAATAYGLSVMNDNYAYAGTEGAPGLALRCASPKAINNASFIPGEVYLHRMDDDGYMQVSGFIRDCDDPTVGLTIQTIGGVVTGVEKGPVIATFVSDAPSSGGAAGDYGTLTVDLNGRLWVKSVPATKATYRSAPTTTFVAVAGTAMFFVISGSATKTVTIQRISMSCPTLTAVAYHNIVVEKWSTAPTLGTATTLVKVPSDSNYAAATANLVQVYTAAPTEGTLVGTIGSQRFLSQSTTAAAAGTPVDKVEWDFRTMGGSSGVVLRGTAQCLSLAFCTAPASAVTMVVEVEWTEE